MFTSDDLSVVIPSYNSRQTILACLGALYHQDEVPREVILVDSSEDNTLEIAQQHYHELRVFRFPRRRFPGPARNKGVAMASGDIVAFTDADCVVAPDWTARIVAQHNAGHNIVGGAIDLDNPESAIALAAYLAEFREFLPDVPAQRLIHVPTCNISYRRDLFERYGGFPDSYYPQEDLLFNYLLSKNGNTVWFDPAIRVRHHSPDRLRSFLSHQHRIGRVTRVTLSRIKLRGSMISAHSWLAQLASPGLGIVKYLRTMAVHYRYARWNLLKRPAVLGLSLLGAIWWARGYAAGARTGLSGVRGVIDPEENIFILLRKSGYDVPPPPQS
jgi:glycosyltransferase involved in cell wall biosynthesis